MSRRASSPHANDSRMSRDINLPGLSNKHLARVNSFAVNSIVSPRSEML